MHVHETCSAGTANSSWKKRWVLKTYIYSRWYMESMRYQSNVVSSASNGDDEHMHAFRARLVTWRLDHHNEMCATLEKNSKFFFLKHNAMWHYRYRHRHYTLPSLPPNNSHFVWLCVCQTILTGVAVYEDYYVCVYVWLKVKLELNLELHIDRNTETESDLRIYFVYI